MKGMAKGLLLLALLFVLGLFAMDVVLEAKLEKRIQTRLRYALRADEVSMEDVDISTLRGRIVVRGIHAKRTGVGHAQLDVGRLEITTAPLGWFFVDSDLRAISLDRAHLQLSAAGLAMLRRSKHKSTLYAEKVYVHDTRITMSLSSLFPYAGTVKIHVQEAEADQVHLQTILSWILATHKVDASVVMTGGVDVGLQLHDHHLTVETSFLGSTPLRIPFAWPAPKEDYNVLQQILVMIVPLAKTIGVEYAKRKASHAIQSVWDSLH